jgi:hypothetical protein
MRVEGNKYKQITNVRSPERERHLKKTRFRRKRGDIFGAGIFDVLVKQWIMSLGPEAYVEEPKSLRDMVKADMKKALVQYERIRPAYQEPAVLENRVDYAS